MTTWLAGHWGEGSDRDLTSLEAILKQTFHIRLECFVVYSCMD